MHYFIQAIIGKGSRFAGLVLEIKMVLIIITIFLPIILLELTDYFLASKKLRMEWNGQNEAMNKSSQDIENEAQSVLISSKQLPNPFPS